MILVTITRISGMKLNDEVDQVWGSYFMIIAAEIGIILTAVTAFRALFVSRYKSEKKGKGAKGSSGQRAHWYSQNTNLLRLVFTLSLWRSKSRGQSTSEGYEADKNGHFPMGNLPDIPRAHMTGVRTVIDGRGKGTDASRIMESQAIQEDDDTWPLHETNKTSKARSKRTLQGNWRNVFRAV